MFWRKRTPQVEVEDREKTLPRLKDNKRTEESGLYIRDDNREYFYFDSGTYKHYVAKKIALPHLPGFVIATTSNYDKFLIQYRSPSNNKYLGLGEVDLPSCESDDSVREDTRDEKFKIAVVKRICQRAILNSRYLDNVPLHVFQMAKELGLDYETEILDGYKTRFKDYVLEEATPEMDCSEATHDAEEKIDYLKNTFLKIRNQLKQLQDLTEAPAKEEE